MEASNTDLYAGGGKLGLWPLVVCNRITDNATIQAERGRSLIFLQRLGDGRFQSFAAHIFADDDAVAVE